MPQRWIAASFLLLLLLGCAPPKPTRIVFFGDSVTDIGSRPGGFVPRLQEALTAGGLKVETLGSGEGGNKITDLEARLARDVLSQQPDVVVIYVGLNDIWHKILPNREGTPPERFEEIYEGILKQLEARKIRFMLCTPSLLGEKKVNPQDADLDTYAEIVRKIGARHHRPVCDLRREMRSYDLSHNPHDEPQGILTTDGIHLTKKGNELAAEFMLGPLKEAIQYRAK